MDVDEIKNQYYSTHIKQNQFQFYSSLKLNNFSKMLLLKIIINIALQIIKNFVEKRIFKITFFIFVMQ